jgi:uncharacterized protein
MKQPVAPRTVLAGVALVLAALVPIAASAQTHVTSTDGTEVTDQKTGLIWRRCAEGMAASSGSCTGTAGTFSYKAALAQAATQAISSKLGWRLPKVRELVSITDLTHSNPAIDSAAFPSTPSSWFWSASTYADDPGVRDLLGENQKKVIDLTVGMNQSFDGSNSTAVWVVGFNDKGQIGIKAGSQGLADAGYVRLVRTAAVVAGSAKDLLDAASRGDAAAVQAFLAKGADVNAMNKDSETALMAASASGHLEAVQTLLAKGAGVNAKSNVGVTALMSASAQGFVEVVEALLSNGAEVNAKATSGATALVLASATGQLDVVQALLAKGAEVNIKIDHGGTALMLASMNGHLDVVRALVAKGADINAKADNGMTALSAATAKGHADVRALLAQAGAKP